MFAVVFEVEPRPECWDEYLSTAGKLRPELERIEGFVENRRFRRTGRPGLVLSLSLWRDAAAVVRWRSHAGHRVAQLKGRARVFRDYRLRVGEIVAQPVPGERMLWLLERPATDHADGWTRWAIFEGLLDPSDRVLLLEGTGDGHAVPEAEVVRAVRVVRDYGMRDRAEAPQEMPPAPAD